MGIIFFFRIVLLYLEQIKLLLMKRFIIWLAKVFHAEFPKKEVVKEYKWIPLDGKITGNIVIEGNVLIEGNVEVTGNVTATGYITAKGTDSDIIALYERNN
jgi:hypothetical protein